MSNKPTLAKNWKKKQQGEGGQKGHPLPLPSGNTALVRRPGVEEFVQGGMVPNALAEFIVKQIEDQQPGKKKKSDAQIQKELDKKMVEVLGDQDGMAQLLKLLDHVTVTCVLQPKVLAVPEDEADRKPNKLYVDEVDLDDKSAIFAFAVGGADDLKPFPGGPAAVVDGAQPRDHLPKQAKRSAGAKRR